MLTTAQCVDSFDICVITVLCSVVIISVSAISVVDVENVDSNTYLKNCPELDSLNANLTGRERINATTIASLYIPLGPSSSSRNLVVCAFIFVP
jgi:hypothetical protein